METGWRFREVYVGGQSDGFATWSGAGLLARAAVADGARFRASALLAPAGSGHEGRQAWIRCRVQRAVEGRSSVPFGVDRADRAMSGPFRPHIPRICCWGQHHRAQATKRPTKARLLGGDIFTWPSTGFMGCIDSGTFYCQYSPVPDDDRYSLTELADLAGVTPRTVRYYLAQGLLPAVGQSGPGSKYGEGHLARLRLIRRLQAEHLPLAEIRRRLAGLTDSDIRGAGRGRRPGAADRLGARLPADRPRRDGTVDAVPRRRAESAPGLAPPPGMPRSLLRRMDLSAVRPVATGDPGRRRRARPRPIRRPPRPSARNGSGSPSLPMSNSTSGVR